MTRRPHVAWIGALAALFAGLTLAGFAAAQQTRETGRTHRDWREGCEPEPDGGELCFIFQRVMRDGRPAANVTIGYKDRGRTPTAVINMPLGVALLPDGLRLETDKGVVGWAPFRFCDKRGCHVELELGAELLRSMKSGGEAWLIVRDLKGRPMRLSFSLLGFTAGMDALKR